MFKILVPVLMAASMASAAASSFDCVPPELPERSISNESVRRVQKKIKVWHRCYASHLVNGHASPDAEKLNLEVDLSVRKWLENTRVCSRNRADILASIERDRRTFLRESPAPSKSSANCFPKLSLAKIGVNVTRSVPDPATTSGGRRHFEFRCMLKGNRLDGADDEYHPCRQGLAGRGANCQRGGLQPPR
ncbi:hypothetical protein [Massilia cavernae]|uniref:hypothetical protein n=1 Tax=Massilia cavernae TaxID=2320864 RepID=UPI0011C3490B|nr:hypothetical protein [Massilia cavernae]